MANDKVQVKPSDLTPFRRQYAALTYRTSGSDTFTLLRDSLVKKFRLVLSGNVSTTYTGTPIPNPYGGWGLVSSMQLTIINKNGTRVVKDVTPYILQRQMFFNTGTFPERRYATGASATANPTNSGLFSFPTSGQVLSLREVIEISFQDLFNYTVSGQSTILDLRDAISANLRLNWAPLASLQRADDSVAITYGTPSFSVELQPVGECFAGSAAYDLVESWKLPIFTSQSKQLVELPVGNALRSIMLSVRNGDSARAFSNMAIQAMRIKVAGVTRWESTFQVTQSGNRNEFAGLNAPYASGKSDLDGCCLIDLTNAGVLETSLDLHGVKQAYLELESSASGYEGTSYAAAPVEVTAHFQEVVFK